jgi:hypothetical protein
VLLQLRRLRGVEVPQPSAELAALMGQPTAADVVRLEDWARKHPRKNRVVFTTLAVAASLGIAGGAAAGNDTLRRQAEGTISSIVNSFSPPPPETPMPAPPSNVPDAPPAGVPSPAGTPPSTVPAGPAAVEVPTTEPSGAEHSVDERPEDSEPPGHSAQGPHDAADPSAVPHSGGQPAEPAASRESPLPSRAGQPPAERAEPLNEGKDKAATNGNRR